MKQEKETSSGKRGEGFVMCSMQKQPRLSCFCAKNIKTWRLKGPSGVKYLAQRVWGIALPMIQKFWSKFRWTLVEGGEASHLKTVTLNTNCEKWTKISAEKSKSLTDCQFCWLQNNVFHLTGLICYFLWFCWAKIQKQHLILISWLLFFLL